MADMPRKPDGPRPSLERDAMTIKMRPFPIAGRQNAATPDSVERSAPPVAERTRAHILAQGGQDAVARRAPLDAPGAVRRERRRSGLGRLDDRARTRAVRWPLSSAACAMRGPRAGAISEQAHPLSVNSTKDERVHYLDHTVEAPAMTLEHLTDQYWFPYFGLLISEQGRVWRHSYLGPFQDGFLTQGQGGCGPAAAGRNQRAPALSSSGSGAFPE